MIRNDGPADSVSRAQGEQGAPESMFCCRLVEITLLMKVWMSDSDTPHGFQQVIENFHLNDG